jgi:hypothetical protein
MKSKNFRIFWIFLAAACLSPIMASAQNKGLDSLFLGRDSTVVMDSLVREMDEFLKILSAPKSFFSVELGAGNRTFSIRNNSFNTQASSSDFISFLPAMGYYHKSGVGITLTGFVSSPNGNAELYQYAVTPSYDYLGDKVATGISYTRYMGKDNTISSSSPYENDFYGYFYFRKKKWRYGISSGYATGSFQDKVTYRDSVLRFNPITQQLEMFRFRVTENSTNRIEDFSLSLSTRRDFDWYRVFSKKDNLSLSLSFYLVSGSSSLQTNGNINVRARNVSITKIRKSFSSLSGTGFQFQSTAFSTSIYYSLGKFNLQPVWFLDYYFPETDKKLNQVFSVTLGFNF